MKITILTYAESAKAEAAGQHDGVVGQVAAALEQNGHTVSVLGVYDDLARLTTGLRRRKPDLVFNLMEMFGESVTSDVAVAGLLELMGIPYTGSGPGELYLAQDKVVGKKLLAFAELLYPKFAVFSKDKGLETGGNLRMPLFVKPARMDASIGIGGKSLVTDSNELMKRVLAIHAEVEDDALAEEYIEGRELYVGVLGNGDPVALPPIEIDFSGMPAGMPHVMGGKAKFDEDSAEFKGTQAGLADLSDELRAKLQQVAIAAYRALRVKDYGRVDLRVNESGELYVIEVNASCYLEQSGEFATAAAAHGIAYPALIQQIVDLAMARYQPARKPARRAAG